MIWDVYHTEATTKRTADTYAEPEASKKKCAEDWSKTMISQKVEVKKSTRFFGCCVNIYNRDRFSHVNQLLNIFAFDCWLSSKHITSKI